MKNIAVVKIIFVFKINLFKVNVDQSKVNVILIHEILYFVLQRDWNKIVFSFYCVFAADKVLALNKKRKLFVLVKNR